MTIDASATLSHIRLTSHTGSGDPSGLSIHWGAPDAATRGPVIGTTTSRANRNGIGPHAGSYGIYRALAMAAGSLKKGHRADLTNTARGSPSIATAKAAPKQRAARLRPRCVVANHRFASSATAPFFDQGEFVLHSGLARKSSPCQQST